MDPDRSAALVLVATPIGNLSDMTPRALSELENASVIACEDTRRTGALLKHFGVPHTPFIVCNEHTEHEAAREIVERVRAGERVALTTDAGMPAISDPGERVVRAVLGAGLAVTCAPGPSAVSMALAVSGLSTERYCFEGFLPRKGRDRADRLEAIASETRTTVVFESPHRVVATVEDLAGLLDGDREIAMARELTKLHEEVWRGSIGDAVEHLRAASPRGEYVLVVAGAEPAKVTDDQIIDALRAELATGMTRRDAIDSVVDGLGVGKRRVYDLALDLP